MKKIALFFVATGMFSMQANKQLDKVSRSLQCGEYGNALDAMPQTIKSDDFPSIITLYTIGIIVDSMPHNPQKDALILKISKLKNQVNNKPRALLELLIQQAQESIFTRETTVQDEGTDEEDREDNLVLIEFKKRD